MIIDSHCHAGQGDGLTGPWDTAAPLAAYLCRARQAGIDRTVLFAAFHSDYAAANRGVARIVARDPRRFIGFAFVNAERDRGRVAAMVAEAVERLGMRGLKVHRHDGRITREVCAGPGGNSGHPPNPALGSGGRGGAGHRSPPLGEPVPPTQRS